MKEKTDLYQKCKLYIEKERLIKEGDVILAAVSGGADSICMLHLLWRLKKEYAFSLFVAHVEHGVRGEESLRDADFVKSYCKELGVPFSCKHVPAPSYAKEHGLSLEEACRQLRYGALRERAALLEQEYPSKKVRIAVAHNQNDQAETVLLHLIRGSKMRGAGGIRPVREKIIRPLLAFSRSEIEAYGKAENLLFCTDATNNELQYARNRIRHEVLPEMSKINAQATEHLADFSEIMQETESYLLRQTKKALLRTTTREHGTLVLKATEFRKEDALIQKRILYACLTACTQYKKDIGAEHVRLLEELLDRQVGRKMDFPYGVCVHRVYAGLQFEKKENKENKEDKENNPLARYNIHVLNEMGGQRNNEVQTEQKKQQEIQQEVQRWKTREEQREEQRYEKAQNDFRIRKFDYDGQTPPLKKKYTKWFDYDKIKVDVAFRTRQSGDYLIIDDAGNRQTVKRYFINEKIPQEERKTCPLLCDGNHVMWVVGHRISAYYKVTKNTKKVLEITYNGGLEE